MNIKTLFHDDFDAKLSACLAKNVLKATTAFNILIKDNPDFFSYPLYSSVKGNLLNYSIEHCLHDAILANPSLNCNVYSKDVNGYHRSILHIETAHFLLTVAKTNKKNTLPCVSKYKLNYAKSNAGGDGQYSFDFARDCNIKEAPYYALLTYGYNPLEQSCDHIDLLIPNSDFKGYVDNKDILSLRKSFTDVPTSSEIEETIAKLKPKFEKQIIQSVQENR